MTQRLPGLLVVGAPKSATTTLVHWLRAHPQAAVSARKELSFFDQHYERGLDWYRSQLPDDPGDRLVVEATPTYLSEPLVAERVAEALPEARFVALLREPVSRAWSNYWFLRMLGVEARAWDRALAGSSDVPEASDQLGYVWRGRYAEQLERWEALVGRGRLHVVLFDEVLADPQAVYDGICSFARIDPCALPHHESVNPTQRPRFPRLQPHLRADGAGRLRRALFRWNAAGGPVPGITPERRARAAVRFAEQNERLQDWLGRPLPASWGVAGSGVSSAVPAVPVGGSGRS